MRVRELVSVSRVCVCEREYGYGKRVCACVIKGETQIVGVGVCDVLETESFCGCKT